MKYIIVFISLLLLSAASCKKNKLKDPLPPATQSGANTMGCYVNGIVWLPDTRDNGSIPRLKAISVVFWNTKSQLLFTFYRQRDGDNQNLDIYLKEFAGVGNYHMDVISKVIGVPGSYGELNNYIYFSDRNFNKRYITNGYYQGIVNITSYDEIERIISGTFQFKAQNYDGSLDSVVVTNGRFDCKID
ncbi:MAG: hypothetical protein JSS98_20215 [Bacteroidetes bacterium]|nr:hypothetical protein [Bacteroidota bacterium]